jgi:flagellar biosynthetic protein FlhB
MAEQSAAERTEQPTAKKLSEARGKGQVPQSQELPAAVMLAVMMGALWFWAPGIFKWFTIELKEGMSGNPEMFSNSGAFLTFANSKIVGMALMISPIVASLMLASVISCLTISGLNFAPGAIKLKWDTISPASGLSKLINAQSLVLLLVSIAKLVFVSVIVWIYLKDKLEVLGLLRWAWSLQMIIGISKIIMGLMIRICVGLIIIAIADSFYQKWKYIQGMKMTKKDVEQERRDTEGMPEVKGRIRRTQFEMAMKRISTEVPKASVVLVNPTHVAVAVSYDSDTMEAPVVVAKGADYLAEKIREIARAHGVPIIRRPELARTLYSTVKVGAMVPENLYVAVAEILALIYRLRHSKV